MTAPVIQTTEIMQDGLTVSKNIVFWGIIHTRFCQYRLLLTLYDLEIESSCSNEEAY